MSGRCRTIVTVQPNRAVLIFCERCDYHAEVPKAAIGRPLGDCMVGDALLRVIYHVELVENGVPEELLRAQNAQNPPVGSDNTGR